MRKRIYFPIFIMAMITALIFNCGSPTSGGAAPAPTFTVTYNGNGNSGGSAPIDANTYVESASVTVLANTSGLVKVGNTFVGWCVNADGSGTSYAAGNTFAMGAANIILYAKWSVNPTYTVTYDGNGNTGGSAPVDSNNYEQFATVTVLGNTGALVKTGSSLVGWCINADGTGTSYIAGDTFAIGTSNVILYAKWSVNPTYTVTYDGNNNTGGSVPTDSNNYEQAAPVTVLGNSGNLVKTGSSFVGWCISSDGSGTSYIAGDTFAMGTINVILYAKWSVNPTYTVTYDGNGNTGGNTPTDSNNYEHLASVTVLGNTGTLTKTGSSFVGWCVNANGSGTSYTGGDTLAMGTTNVILYAKWSVNPTFSVTYSGNGNTGGNVPADSNYYEQSASVTVLGNTGSLIKAGSSFVGWCVNSNGTGISYIAGDTFAMGTSNVILYAKWSLNPTYTVTYSGNGNTGGNAPTDSGNYEQFTSVTVLGNTGSLTKTGSSFVGWCVNSNGSGTSYIAGDTFAMGTSNVILYAKWSLNPTYTVTYNGNGNTGGNAPTDSGNYEQFASVSVLGNTGSLIKTGSSFAGWCVNSNGTGTSYIAGDTFAMGSSNVILYAKWSLNPTFTVTYNGNGNTGGNAPTDSDNYEQFASVTVLGNTGSLIKTGSSFVGWCVNSNGTGTSYIAGDTFAMGSSNVILYAKWSLNPTYTVTYNGNGNTGGSAPTDTNTYEQAVSVTVLGNTGSLTKTGNSFVGWCIASNGSGTSYIAGDTFAMGTSNVILYAKWSLNPTYTVTYNGNGNTGGNAPTDTNTYEQAASVTVLGNTGSLIKSGSSFVGWCVNSNGTGTSYISGDTFAMGTSNVILYAKWSLNPTYTVTYNGNGNTGGNAPTDTNTYEEFATVNVFGNTGSLTKTGSSFVGWAVNADGSGTSYIAGDSFAMGSSNVILYAKWSLNPTYTVTYNGNGNTGGSVPTDTNHYEQAATVTVLGNTGSLTKTGNSFVGWCVNSNGTGASYIAADTFAMGTSNVILYAKWSLNATYTVTYNGNGNTSGSAPTDSTNYETGFFVTVLSNTGSLAKTGSTFVGWCINADGTGTSYTPGAIFAMGSSNITLYAEWTALPTYQVTYTGNGNDGGNVPIDSTSYLVGSTVTVLGNVNGLTKSNSTFVGWYDAAATATYYPGNQFVIDGPITLSAVWTTNATYTITYNGNGSTGGNSPTDSTAYENGALVTVLANTGNLTKTGNNFIGWNTAANGSGTAYSAGNTFNMGTANVILYAQWSALTTFTVTYNGNTSTGGSVPVDGSSYLTGATVSVLANTGSLTKTGNAFAGWNTQANGLGTSYDPAQQFAMGSANVILYAKWALDSAVSWTDFSTKGLPSAPYDAVATSASGVYIVAVINRTTGTTGIYTSSNSGNAWTRTGTTAASYRSVAMSQNSGQADDGKYAVAGINGGLLYVSSNFGAGWTGIAGTSQSWRGVAVSATGQYMVAAIGATSGRIYRSTNYGVAWNLLVNSPTQNFRGIASSSDGTVLAAIVSGGGIWVSTDSGANWTQKLTTAAQWRGVAVSGNGQIISAAIQAGTYPASGIWVSNDPTKAFTTWVQTDTLSVSYRCLAMSNNGAKVGVGIKGSTGGFVSFSANYGVNWYQRTYTGMRVWTGIAASSDGSKFYVSSSDTTSTGSVWVYAQ